MRCPTRSTCVAGSCAATSSSGTRRVPWFGVGSATVMLDFSGRRRDHLHQWRRGTTSRGGREQKWSHTTMASKSGKPWGYQAGQSYSAPRSEPTCGSTIDRVLLCVSAIVAVMTRVRDGHEGAAKEEVWFAYDLRACGWSGGRKLGRNAETR